MDGMWCVCTARTRAQRACVYSARGWAVMLARGHVGDAHYSGLGTDAQEPRQLRTARDYPRAPPAACEHVMDMRVYVERCLGALRRRAVGDRGAMMLQWQHSSSNLHPPRHHTTTADPRHKELAQPRCLPAGTCVSRWRLPRAEGGQPSRRRVRCRRSLARHPCSHSSPCQVLAGAGRYPQVRETTRYPCRTAALTCAPSRIFFS